MRQIVRFALLFAAAITATALIAVAVWWEVGAIGVHGWLAMAAAVFGISALAATLMRLLFLSARAGFDDAAGTPDSRPADGDQAAGGAPRRRKRAR